MFLAAYPSADVLSQEAHEAMSKVKASGMFQGFLVAIRKAIKDEQASNSAESEKILTFTRMVTDVRGTLAKETAAKESDKAARLLIN